MPVPVTWANLSTTPANNSPKGSEPVGTQMDDYLRSAFAFLKQLHDQWLAADGTVAWTGNQNANTHSILNVPWPSDPNAVAPKGYVDNVITTTFPRGTVVMWYGQAASKPAGWLICDGTNGTPDMRDRVPYGAGGGQGVPAYGGNNSMTLTAANMPIHSHSVNDSGHVHNMYDPGHTHGINDPGHWHALPNAGSVQAGADNGGAQSPVATGYSSGRTQLNTNAASTGIGMTITTANTACLSTTANVSVANSGGSAGFDMRPAWCALYFLMKA